MSDERMRTPDGEFVDIPKDVNIHIIRREDGRIERACVHGVGHPIGHQYEWKSWMRIHGCCGCCAKWSKETAV